MYKALCEWRDLQDGHLYKAGEPFPHDGRRISADRIETLINGKNSASKPLILKVEQVSTEQSKAAQKPKRTRKAKE